MGLGDPALLLGNPLAEGCLEAGSVLVSGTDSTGCLGSLEPLFQNRCLRFLLRLKPSGVSERCLGKGLPNIEIIGLKCYGFFEQGQAQLESGSRIFVPCDALTSLNL